MAVNEYQYRKHQQYDDVDPEDRGNPIWPTLAAIGLLIILGVIIHYLT